MSIFDEIERDAKAGTPGDWMREDALVYSLMHSGWNKGEEQLKNRFSAHVQHDQRDSTEGEAEANARRIVRLPDLERIALAAKELADEMEKDFAYYGLGMTHSLTAALTAFKEATK